MKKLYSFSINKEVDVEETTVNEDGSKTVKTVRKSVPQRFFLRKPNRSLFDAAELYYNVQLSKFVEAGCLMHNQLAKRVSNDGGSMSEPEKKKYTEAYTDLFKKQNEYQHLAATKKDEERTEEEKEAIKKVMEELAELTTEIQKMEYGQITLFDNTAENMARSRAIRWWVLQIAYEEDADGNGKPYFGDGTFDDKLKKFDEIEENADSFQSELIKKLLYYIAFWFVGKASKQEEFEQLTFNID